MSSQQRRRVSFTSNENFVVNMISSFEESINPTQSTDEFKYKNHHEDIPAFRQRFVGDVKRFLKNFIVNPFNTDDFTAINNNTIILMKR